ncbi:MAG: thiamine phosphate synthase [Prevotella sp.]|nr:thiamine phosphate synthase [Prevotella sp.]MEE0337213.1 thiamine phosphate synthase [Prevotella sp.]
MKLIIMTKSTFFVEEDKILSALFEQGMDNLHLYKPGASPMYAERLLSLMSDDYYNKITVHGHFYLKDEYHLAGIHLDTTETEIPVGYKGKIGRSCNNLEQLKEMKKTSNCVFLHNIFNSLSNSEDKSTFTMQQLEDAADKGLIDKKVYAMGGMTCDNIRIAKELGFGGVVIRGDIWNRFDIHQQVDFKNVINHFEKLRKSIG